MECYSTCLSGTMPNYSYDSYEETFIGCQTIPSGYCMDTMEEYGYLEWTIIEGNQATLCNNEGGSTSCDDDPDTFILSGNTITIISSDGESNSSNISLSSDGSMATVVGTFSDDGCSATVTQTWTKQ